MSAPAGESGKEQLTEAAVPQREIRTTTIAAIGGIVACTLLALRDPTAREHCHRVARDPLVRRRLAETIRRLAGVSDPALEGKK